jgi:parallel beta-helix repeat protein
MHLDFDLGRVAPRLAVMAIVASTCLLFGTTDQALAARVTCGQTIVANTKLANDLIDCPSNGIVIGADNITLDLNGHVIDGDASEFAGCPPDEPCDLGVFSSGFDGVTIKGGTVREFTFGVILDGAENARLSRLALNDNLWSGLLVAGTAHSTVEGLSVTGNGLTTDQAGIDVFDSHDLAIERNSVVGNGDIGFYIIGLENSRIDGNSVARNPETGILMEGNQNNLTRNRFSENGDAIVVSGDRNTVAANQVSGSTCDDDCGFGVSLEGGTGNVIERNVITHLHQAAIRVASFESEGGPPTTGNTVSANLIHASDIDGVLVEATATDTTVARNLVIGSGDDAIDVDNAKTTLTGNITLRNGDLGIEAVPGVTDGGANKAHANGNAAQCTNVVCK